MRETEADRDVRTLKGQEVVVDSALVTQTWDIGRGGTFADDGISVCA